MCADYIDYVSGTGNITVALLSETSQISSKISSFANILQVWNDTRVQDF